MRKRIEVKAVWNTELEQLLSSLGILESLLLGELTCANCGRTIDLDNLGAIVPQKDNIVLACDDTPCIHALSMQEVHPQDE